MKVVRCTVASLNHNFVQEPTSTQAWSIVSNTNLADFTFWQFNKLILRLFLILSNIPKSIISSSNSRTDPRSNPSFGSKRCFFLKKLEIQKRSNIILCYSCSRISIVTIQLNRNIGWSTGTTTITSKYLVDNALLIK